MGLFGKKSDDQSATGSNASAADAFGEGSESAPPAPIPAPVTTPQTIVIQNGQMDAATRAQLQAVGFDPDAFVNQMEAIGKAAEAGATPAPAANLDMDELGEQLTQLKKLHDSGALTDDEYKAAKAKVLG